MNKKKMTIRSERGNVLIEFALILPVLILIIAGIIQFGFLLNAKIAVNTASYEAVRAATLSDDPEAGAIEAAISYASASLPGWKIGERLSVEVIRSGNLPGDMVQVNILYNVPLFFSEFLIITENSNDFIIVSGSSSMGIEEKD